MSKNISDPERIIRLIIGAFITSLAFWGPQSNWYLLGIIPMATGFIGTCPLYSLLGINTNHKIKINS